MASLYMAPADYLTIWPERMQDDPRRSRTLALLPEEMGSDPVSNSQTKEKKFRRPTLHLEMVKEKTTLFEQLSVRRRYSRWRFAGNARGLMRSLGVITGPWKDVELL
jgi:hypothetical protein